MRRLTIPDRFRPAAVGVLIAAVVMAAILNLAILDAHGKLYWSYPVELASGIWKYGPIGVFTDPSIPPVRLSDPATLHSTCDASCDASEGGVR